MYLICLHLFDNNEFIDIPYFWNYTYVPIIRFAGEKKHLLTTYLRQPEVEKLNILTINNKETKKGKSVTGHTYKISQSINFNRATFWAGTDVCRALLSAL